VPWFVCCLPYSERPRTKEIVLRESVPRDLRASAARLGFFDRAIRFLAQRQISEKQALVLRAHGKAATPDARLRPVKLEYEAGAELSEERFTSSALKGPD